MIKNNQELENARKLILIANAKRSRIIKENPKNPFTTFIDGITDLLIEKVEADIRAYEINSSENPDITRRDKILASYADGKLILVGENAYEETEMTEFIKAPVDQLLEELQFDEEKLLKHAERCECWVGDYAVIQVIKALKNKINSLESQIHSQDIPSKLSEEQ